ncbi:MAG: GtrA family protein [Clostridiales bacterium]|nr:GtrA family protein [Candidatus Crickella caballi]
MEDKSLTNVEEMTQDSAEAAPEIKKKRNTRETIRAIKFFFVSMSAGLIEIGSFTIFDKFVWTDSYWPCYLTALILSVLWNFTINRRYTFKSTKNVPRAMAMIFGYYCVFTPVTTILGNYLAGTLLWNEYLVTIMNMSLNLVTEYLFDTFVVYRNEMDNNDIAKREEEKMNNK